MKFFIDTADIEEIRKANDMALSLALPPILL